MYEPMAAQSDVSNRVNSQEQGGPVVEMAICAIPTNVMSRDMAWALIGSTNVSLNIGRLFDLKCAPWVKIRQMWIIPYPHFCGLGWDGYWRSKISDLHPWSWRRGGPGFGLNHHREGFLEIVLSICMAPETNLIAFSPSVKFHERYNTTVEEYLVVHVDLLITHQLDHTIKEASSSVVILDNPSMSSIGHTSVKSVTTS